MPDEDNPPLLVAPLVAIVLTALVLVFAQLIPNLQGHAGGLHLTETLRRMLGQ